MKLQRKIYEATSALNFFMMNNWEFKNQKFMDLSLEIRPEDTRAFSFDEFVNFDSINFLKKAMLGARRYLLHFEDSNLLKSRDLYQKMSLVDTAVKTIIFFIISYIILIKYNMLDVLKVFIVKL